MATATSLIQTATVLNTCATGINELASLVGRDELTALDYIHRVVFESSGWEFSSSHQLREQMLSVYTRISLLGQKHLPINDLKDQLYQLITEATELLNQAFEAIV
ncbi:hypothetical protein VB638_05295 [Dolichospermum sp. UHCC 0684]|uniref:hypothetical protein n=1 Tax=unclassified Dolichospermum TaxID=2622029 RepID=UPI001445812C|nr:MULTISPECIES: hypothetical protein [unclassified Dolichospermum]MEA5529009.1 hypothetical protein [Dolichospermum sp. UHCC 0684]MTJ33995.1 hypothetical protein [Dolichospermum sp. UHCC 0260]